MRISDPTVPQAEPELHRFTIEEYLRLGESFPRSELLDGLIYDVSPTNRAHAHAVRALVKSLVLGLADKPYWVEPGTSLAVHGWQGPWGPEPDIAVLVDETYTKTPTAENAAAIIEVSDSSDAWDRKQKIPLYVASGVPTWRVNLPARQVEYYPSPESLDDPQIFLEGDTFEVLGVSIAVTDLLLPVAPNPDT